MIPLFTSHYSLGKSILTLEKTEEINTKERISIFAIAAKHKLKEVNLVDNTFSGFIEAYKSSLSFGIKLNFGFKVTLCNDASIKDELSINTEHRVIVWLKNTDAYKPAIRIASKAWSNNNFYYIPRLDMEQLINLWDDSLALSTSPYSNFIHNNSLKNKKCFPKFDKIKPTLFYSEMDLAFDKLLINKTLSYAEKNKLETEKVHPIYYYNKEDAKAYLVYRCIHNRNVYNKPEISHFCSDSFSFESYLNKKNE